MEDTSEIRSIGRPRDQKVHQAILKSALKEIARRGFRDLKIDDVADAAGVGKTTIYRRWPNKAALVMDAFLELVGPETEFPAAKSILLRIQKQLRLQSEFFSGRQGQIIRQLIGEAQFDRELAAAFNERWLQPRRAMTRRILEAGVKSGELLIADFDLATDMLYGPFYYRLTLRSDPLGEAFVGQVFKAWARAFAKA